MLAAPLASSVCGKPHSPQGRSGFMGADTPLASLACVSFPQAKSSEYQQDLQLGKATGNSQQRRYSLANTDKSPLIRSVREGFVS